MSSERAVVLMNVGTPDAPTTAAVRRYLREFLSDPYVVDLPAPARWALVHLVIAPFRAPRSAEAYRAIWTDEGSPLLATSLRQRDGLAERLGLPVVLAMRYGNPGVEAALDELDRLGAREVVLAPLFPQYARATTGTVLDAFVRALRRRRRALALREVAPFYADPGFASAWAKRLRAEIATHAPDHVLFSYHGLPERHVRAEDEGGAHCLVREGCCDAIGPANARCYRAQCYATSRALAAGLGVPSSTSFQSRLGPDRWIGPSTEARLAELARAGVRRLLVACPAFVADCLETLEEIGLRGRASFLAAGGEALHLVPSLNDDDAWLDALAALVRNAPARSLPVV